MQCIDTPAGFPRRSLSHYIITDMDEKKTFNNEEEQQEVATPISEATTTEPEVTEVPAETIPQDGSEAPEEETNTTPEETTGQSASQPKTKEEVIERLRRIAHEGVLVTRPELEHLKQIYYHIHNAEAAAARDAFVANGGQAEDFQPAIDPLEESFRAEMNLIKELRAKEAALQEKQKQENLKRKQEIIEQIKTYGESPEIADTNYEALRKLQAEWREIKAVPAENATELWKNYQLYIERFYDQLHLNHEARMYDFKKNLEKKVQLCEAAERLADVDDPISAFHQLQNLHHEFRETGPVEREQRETIWERFKAASTVVNKRHQAHFEEIKAQEESNLQKKTELCEKVEALDVEKPKTYADWDKMTQEVLAMQSEWKTIGFTPRKVNAKIFERFRAACDRFFQAKAQFFRTTRETYAANLEAKNRLVEEAEALRESTDWNSTANKLIALQKQWKETGPVPHKTSEAVWHRFNEACNYFFERKAEATGDQRREEEENLTKKKQIIADLEALLTEEKENVQQLVHDLQDKWNSIGHVPFRKKDKIYARYRETLDRIYGELHITARRRNLENFRRSVAEKGGNELSRERQRLQAAYDAKKDEVQTYETNLGFFSSKSKKGNSLVEEIQKKIERLKTDLADLTEKIRAIHEQERTEEKETRE